SWHKSTPDLGSIKSRLGPRTNCNPQRVLWPPSSLSFLAASAAPFVDVSLVLAIIGFVSTIAVARFVTEGDIVE
ncbi:MAG: monovalent cation/H+ antiporter complex subunit F, partial [Haloarculaceae archaeon]